MLRNFRACPESYRSWWAPLHALLTFLSCVLQVCCHFHAARLGQHNHFTRGCQGQQCWSQHSQTWCLHSHSHHTTASNLTRGQQKHAKKEDSSYPLFRAHKLVSYQGRPATTYLLNYPYKRKDEALNHNACYPCTASLRGRINPESATTVA